jgi:nucleoside-diphosphate-sugar epimerase
MKKNILITGGAGFIGSNFANINKEKYNITCLDNFFLGSKDNLNENIKLIEGDACKKEDLEKCGNNFYAVIHLAGTSSAPMFMDDGFVKGYTNSIESFVTTLEFSRKLGVKKFLYASTSSLYGNNPLPLLETQNIKPLNHYSVTKGVYEDCSACYHKVYPEMDIFGFRFMSVFGPNEENKGKFANIISQFLWDMVRDLKPVIYGDGNQFRDFTNVTDIVQALTLAIETPENFGNKVYNVGRGESMSLNKIVTTIQKVIKKDIKPIYIKNPVKEGYINGQHADITLIQKELKFSPKKDLIEGIEDIYKNLDIKNIKETSSQYFRK